MGNASSVRGEGEGEQMGEEQEVMSQDLMRQSPPISPRGAAYSPLLFTPQAPMAPLQRFEEISSPSDAWMQGSIEYEDIFYEQGIPTMINWSYGGKDVCVEGSWDNWKTKKFLTKSGKDFSIMKILPSGVYQYRFIVDGEWRYDPEIPWVRDEMGNAYNILDLKESVPEDIGSIAGFEQPRSPEASYNSLPLPSEDYSKEPPIVPPQLHQTLLNTESSIDSSSSLSRPQHVVLDHLYIQKGKASQPVVALSETHRFMGKYVTVVLYKSLAR